MDNTSQIRDLFSSFDLRRAEQPITDYSGNYQSCPFFEEIYPTSIEEVSKIVRTASLHRIPIRIRGNGHSLNGSSLPKERELLIRSERLNYFQFLPGNQCTVGGGVALWDLHEMLETRGYALLMMNGGFVAPTIAGFISAGGLGNNTALLGGFWETVLEITLVTGQGEVLKVNREDPLFPWVFGSMGQLGIIVEVKMRIIDTSATSTSNSFSEGFIPRSIPPNEKYCWFTLFLPLEKEQLAKKQLGDFAAKWKQFWIPKDDYCYVIAYRHFNPPLLFPHQGPFLGMGIWGQPKGNNDLFDDELIDKMDADFHEIVLSEACFRRYIQTEMVPRKLDYQRYFGREIYAHFFALKRKLDPHMLFNRETIFSAAS